MRLGNGDPPTIADFTEPVGIRAVVCEMIGVTLDGESGVAQDAGKFLAEVAIGEEDRRHATSQAARSYNTASSISATLRS